jgi:hypothetical protein
LLAPSLIFSLSSFLSGLRPCWTGFYHLSHSASNFSVRVFCLFVFGFGVFFLDMVSLYAQTGLDHKPLICAFLCGCGDRHVHCTRAGPELCSSRFLPPK